MSKSKHRTSFALDEQTIERLEQLSRRWNISRAEVIRRAVKHAVEQAEVAERDAGERLEEYRARGGLPRERADAFLREVAEDRTAWRRQP